MIVVMRPHRTSCVLALAASLLAVLAAGASAPRPDDRELLDELLEAHNRERAKAKLPPLKANKQLEAAALAQAKDMAEHEKLTHEGSDGSTPALRVKRQGYGYLRTGENVADGQKTVDGVMATWMESKPHRENILGDYTEMGAARAIAEDGTPYWCVDLGKPWAKSDPDKAAAELVEAMNKARAAAKKAPMKADAKLAEVARRHARDMAEKNKFLTEDSDGVTPFDRIKKMGLRYAETGQSDLAGQSTPDDVVETWLASAEHKGRLLGNYSRIGVGYATAKDGMPYWSVIFARPFRR
jgi:uncharacterized protein YkwD